MSVLKNIGSFLVSLGIALFLMIFGRWIMRIGIALYLFSLILLLFIENTELQLIRDDFPPLPSMISVLLFFEFTYWLIKSEMNKHSGDPRQGFFSFLKAEYGGMMNTSHSIPFQIFKSENGLKAIPYNAKRCFNPIFDSGNNLQLYGLNRPTFIAYLALVYFPVYFFLDGMEAFSGNQQPIWFYPVIILIIIVQYKMTLWRYIDFANEGNLNAFHLPHRRVAFAFVFAIYSMLGVFFRSSNPPRGPIAMGTSTGASPSPIMSPPPILSKDTTVTETATNSAERPLTASHVSANPARNQKVNLFHGGNQIVGCSIDTILGLTHFKDKHEDARFLSKEQFRLHKDADGNWLVSHMPTATNETLLDGKPITTDKRLTEGAVISVGNSEKGLLRFPLIVRFC